jgi:hypothetical protein
MGSVDTDGSAEIGPVNRGLGAYCPKYDRLAREFDRPHPAHPLPWIRERQLWGAEAAPYL